MNGGPGQLSGLPPTRTARDGVNVRARLRETNSRKNANSEFKGSKINFQFFSEF